MKNGKKIEKALQIGERVLFPPLLVGDAVKKKKPDEIPISLETLSGKRYHLPRILHVVDVKDQNIPRDIQAIKEEDSIVGWETVRKGRHILHLFDQRLDKTGVKFLSPAEVGGIYCSLPYESSSFWKASDYIDFSLEAISAELGDIAFMLGAKSYSIEIVDEKSDKTNQSGKMKVSAKLIKNKGETQTEFEQSQSHHQKYETTWQASFKDIREPRQPKLNWFANNSKINNLVKQCLEAPESRKTQVIKLACSQIGIIDTSLFSAVELTAKKFGGGSEIGFKKTAEKIHHHILNYEIYFD